MRRERQSGGGTTVLLRRTRQGTATALLCLAAIEGGTAAQSLAAEATPPSATTGAETYRFAIAPQSLTSALLAFSKVTGVQFFFGSDVARALQSPGAGGTLTSEEALRRLLAGTGLTYRFTNPDTVTLQGAAEDGALLLGPVSVEALGGTAWGPVQGYVAADSAAGTKTDTPIIETPQTIDVVTREQMDQQGAQTVPQALRYSPGVLTERNGADQRSDYLYSRGFELDQYVDGLRLLSGTWSIPQVEAYGVERIDVLKGPASVLYGQASPGGVASIVTKRPLAEPLHEVELQTGSHKRMQAAFDFGGPLDTDGRYLYRLTGLGRYTDTQVDHTTEERFYLAPAFTWQPDADTSLTVLTSALHDPSTGIYYKLPARGTALDNPNGRIPTHFFSGDKNFNQAVRSQYSFATLFEHRFDDRFTFRQNLRYMQEKADYKILVVGNLAPDLHTINRSAYAASERTDGVTIDNQLESRFSTGPLDHRLLAGIDGQYAFSDRNDSFGSAPSIDYLDPVYGQTIADPPIFLRTDQTQRQLGLYLQDQVKFGRWSLVLGGRQDWARTDTNDKLYDSSSHQTDQAFTGRAGLLSLFDSGVAPYVSYSESFEPVAGTDRSGNAFKPTRGRQWEGGLKYEPPGFDAFLGLSVYQLTQKNVLTPDQTDPNFSVQTGEIRSRGVEIDGKASIFEGLNLTLAYAYNRTEVTQSNDGYEGNDPVYTPRHTASGWLDYTFAKGPLSGLGLGAGVRYVGKSYGDAANSFEVDSVTLFDAAARYRLDEIDARLEGVSLSLNATNLMDKRYVAGCQNINTCYYGQRRTLYATIGYSW